MGVVIVVVVGTTAAPVEDGEPPAVMLAVVVVELPGAIVDLKGQLVTSGPQEVIVTSSVWYTISVSVGDASSVVKG